MKNIDSFKSVFVVKIKHNSEVNYYSFNIITQLVFIIIVNVNNPILIDLKLVIIS